MRLDKAEKKTGLFLHLKGGCITIKHTNGDQYDQFHLKKFFKVNLR